MQQLTKMKECERNAYEDIANILLQFFDFREDITIQLRALLQKLNNGDREEVIRDLHNLLNYINNNE